MAEAVRIRELIERVVGETVGGAAARLQDEISERVAVEVQPLLVHAQQSGLARLKSAVLRIQEQPVQSGILQALLDGIAVFSARTALLLVRGSTAYGWQARGFATNALVQQASVDLNSGLGQRALELRMLVRGPAATVDARFFAALRVPVEGECVLLPLVIREKVAALIYADAAGSPVDQLDAPALELLVGSAGTWLELVALRRATQSPPSGANATVAAQTAASVTGNPTVSAAPAASRAPNANPALRFSAAADSSASEGVLPATAVAKTEANSKDGLRQAPEPRDTSAESGAAVRAANDPASSEEEETHRKARRLAKLLVDELKLYNQRKVVEGKLNRDIYDRLKVDIEKSRATYERRYADTPAGSADYFVRELIRSLADNNAALLGSNFPG